MNKPYKITNAVGKKLVFEYHVLKLSFYKLAERNNLSEAGVRNYFLRNNIRSRNISASMKLIHSQRLDKMREEADNERSKTL